MQPFEQVVAEHGAAVLRVCRALLPSVDADDAWSETFLSALQAYPRLAPGSNVRGWLVTIAHRKAMDRHRAMARGPVPTDRLPERPTSLGLPEPPEDQLWARVRALPPKQRAAVAYRYLGGLSYRQIGDLLDSNEAAARRSAADGVAALRTQYQQELTS